MWRSIICRVEEPDAREVVDLIRAAGRKAVPLPGDLRDEAFCNKLVADAVRELGGLDILVSNAARQEARESIMDISTQQFDDTFKTNVYAMFWLTKAAFAAYEGRIGDHQHGFGQRLRPPTRPSSITPPQRGQS